MSAWRRSEIGSALEGALADLVAFSKDERRRLYRLHLQATLGFASPLAVDLAASAGLELEEVARLLPVPRTWGTHASEPARPKWRGVPRLKAKASGLSTSTALRVGRTGVAIRGAEDPLGDLGFLPERGVLEAVARIGRASITTSAGSAYIVIRDDLPETVLLAAVGRPVDAVVSHPALDGCGYLVADAFNDEFVGGAVLKFGTGLTPLRLPWAEELDREVSRRLGRTGDPWRHVRHPAAPVRPAAGERGLRTTPSDPDGVVGGPGL